VKKTITFEWDKVIQLADLDEVTGMVGMSRIAELMVVNEVLRHPANLPRLRLLVARDLGYADLAADIQSVIDKDKA
jgi:hypothetical protein